MQEYFHKNATTKISYTLVAERGPDHDKEFDMCVNIDDVVKGYGTIFTEISNSSLDPSLKLNFIFPF